MDKARYASGFSRESTPGDDLFVGRRPHGRQRAFQEAAVSGGGHARIKHRNNTFILHRADQSAGALGEADRCVGSGDLHEAIAAVFGDVLGAGLRDRIVRAREGNFVDDHQAAGIAWHVNTLPEGHRAKQAGVAFGGEVCNQGFHARITLTKDFNVKLFAQDRGGFLRRALGGEQGQRATT